MPSVELEQEGHDDFVVWRGQKTLKDRNGTLG
jgi:hypothetical protein